MRRKIGSGLGRIQEICCTLISSFDHCPERDSSGVITPSYRLHHFSQCATDLGLFENAHESRVDRSVGVKIGPTVRCAKASVPFRPELGFAIFTSQMIERIGFGFAFNDPLILSTKLYGAVDLFLLRHLVLDITGCEEAVNHSMVSRSPL